VNNMVNKLLEKIGSNYRLVSFEQMNERRNDAQEIGRLVAQQAYEKQIDELNQQHLELQERERELKRRLACAISSAHYYRKKAARQDTSGS
jgi:hypothetical protein